MLIQNTTDFDMVRLTEDPNEARELQKRFPVIGLTGPEPEYSLWFGVSYLAEAEESVSGFYRRRVCSRFFHRPLIIADEIEDIKTAYCIRESCRADLEGIMKLYEDETVKRYLKHPLSRFSSWEEWMAGYRAGCEGLDGPHIWSVVDQKDSLVGRFGLEWQDAKKDKNIPAGYYLGYALFKEYRGRRLIDKLWKAILPLLEEEWEIETVYLKSAKENQASVKTAKRLGFEPVLYADNSVFMSVSISSITERT